MACRWIAEVTRAVGIVTTSERGWVVAGIAARATEQSAGTARAAGVVGACLFDWATDFFGDTNGAGQAAGVITTKVRRCAAVGTAVESGLTDACRSGPDLLTGATDRFGRWCGAPGGIGISRVTKRAESGAATEAKESLDDRTSIRTGR